MRVPPLVKDYCLSICSARFQRVGLEERLDAAARTATCAPASTRSSSSTWATRSTTRRWPPDRPAAVHGRARPLRRRGARREGGLRVRQDARPLRRSWASATGPRSSSSTARTRSTAWARSSSCTSTWEVARGSDARDLACCPRTHPRSPEASVALWHRNFHVPTNRAVAHAFVGVRPGENSNRGK